MRTLLLASALLLTLPPLALPVQAACVDDHTFFVGVVYDSEQRADFIKDVDNFEYFLARLRETRCIPDSQVAMLAFQDNFTRNGKTYPEASEAGLRAALATMATAANAYPDSKLFFFLSSHGNSDVGYACSGSGTRAVGSFAFLKPTGSTGIANGFLYDCELGGTLNRFAKSTPMVILVDCSFCGGFSDSLTAASGTVPDGSVPVSAGIVRANRTVFTGCAITTECFGSDTGGVSFSHLRSVLEEGIEYCDGWTVPGFPAVQGVDAPVNNLLTPHDGTCTATEWMFGAAAHTQATFDIIGIQQQYRVKYGFPDLASDVRIL